MSFSINKQTRVNSSKPTCPHDGGSAPPRTEQVEHLLHELANGLDGALRHIGLAISDLQSTPIAPRSDAIEPQSRACLRHLEVAEQAMRQMACEIGRWRRAASAQGDTGDPPRTLQEVVQAVLRLLKPEADKLAVQVVVDLSDAVAGLPAGPTYRVIFNAIRNAIDAISESIASPSSRIDRHRVEVVGRLEGDQVVLQFHDTGSGVHPALLDERGGVRFGVSTKAGADSGRGIGLLVCREVALELRGSIELANRSPQGATFTFRFPLSGVIGPSWHRGGRVGTRG